MYADREESDTHRSVKDRLNGNTADSSSARPRRPSSGKRRREDEDKWEHDLFDTEKPQRSNGRLSGQDLRLKLQKKNTQSMKGSYSGGGGGVRDLREKLSGIVNQQTIEPPRQKLKRASEVNKPVRKSFLAETPVSEARKVSSSVTKKKTQQKVDLVDNFLQSLGLEKYSITFQAEEVDMDALIHMTDDDLKAMGIPMGPRKKILLTLESKV